MHSPLLVRPLRQQDFESWRLLWNGYNDFYGRSGPTALPDSITQATWQRFFSPIEPVFGLTVEQEDRLVGITHYLFHLSTTKIEPVCYLQDLYTLPAARGQGVGRVLIEAVYEQAKLAGSKRV